MNNLLVASRNKDKAHELVALLGDLPVAMCTLHDVEGVPEIVEDAETLEGNAIKKATVAFERTGLPSVADDTGLEVGYLQGAPGVYSARYAGPGASYADNVRKLIGALKGVPPRRRNARFRCVMAFVSSGGVLEVVEGSCPGSIIEAPRGNGGFGYDPVFLPDGHRQTFAEMDLATKNGLSHRARAALAMRPVLVRYFSGVR
jgi:XTP/dITP diphosphohydrolase